MQWRNFSAASREFTVPPSQYLHNLTLKITAVPFSKDMLLKIMRFRQGCGSRLDPDSIGSLDPDPDPGGQK